MKSLLKASSLLSLLFFCSSILAAQNAKECYEQQDATCLEKLAETKNVAAYYYLGLHKWKRENNIKSAKNYFEMVIFYGNGDFPEAKSHLHTFYKDKLITFKASECDIADISECLENLADEQNDKAAQYLLAKKLVKSAPEKAVEYFTQSAAQGHTTSACILSDIYSKGLTRVEPDYHKEVEWGFKCSVKPPFKKLNKKHFEKYNKTKDHKAYAFSDTGRSSYANGHTSPDAAALIALAYCSTHNKKNETEFPCRVINIDGNWVKDPKIQPFADHLKGTEKLTTDNAKKYYLNGYQKVKGNKVFVFSHTGAYRAKSSTKKSVEELTKKAMKECRSSNNKWESKYPCKVVDVNGEWVD